MLDNITAENIHLECHAKNKAEVLSMVGKEFKAKGYINQDCIAFLNEREQQVSTFLGNGITLPYLTYQNQLPILSLKQVLRSSNSQMVLFGIETM